jgi:ribonucleotide monophosphatase NagD (HAD superfamily)
LRKDIPDVADIYMVGDSPDSDIKGGQQNGLKTILVETGNYRKGETKLEIRPDYILEDVKLAVEKII